jgi:hypothetical protein
VTQTSKIAQIMPNLLDFLDKNAKNPAEITSVYRSTPWQRVDHGSGPLLFLRIFSK